MTWYRKAAARSMAGALLAAAGVLGGCDLPAHPKDGRVGPADAPSRLLNPLCGGTGGTAHPGGTITASQTWAPAGNPHRVTGGILVSAGATLALAPGALVCFDPYTSIQAQNGGRLNASGLATAEIVLTATDPALGWNGLELSGAPDYRSWLTHVRIEHVSVAAAAVKAWDSHLVVIDSAVIRQSGQAAVLRSPGSRIVRSRVDTTTSRRAAAVVLGDSTRFVQTTIRRAAGVGLLVEATAGAIVNEGRIEASGGVGLRAVAPGAVQSGNPVRVVGGGSYGAELSLGALAKIYPAAAD